MKRHIACFCETTFEADMPEAADATQDPGIEEQILDGSFMELHCPACGAHIANDDSRRSCWNCGRLYDEHCT